MSYGTRAGFRAYALERGDTTPTTATDAAADAALVRAKDYIKFSYVQRFSDGLDETAENVEAAHYTAAILELGSPGFWSKVYTEAESKVLVGVGELRWELTGSIKNARSFSPRSTKIENLLWPYMSFGLTATVV